MTVVAPAAHELGRVRSIALSLAGAWSAALIAGAFFVPMYSSDGSGGAGSATLVGENGTGVIIPVMIPLLVVLAVANELRHGRRTNARVVTGLLVVFNFLAMLSIGIFVLPVTVCLVIASARQPSQ